MSYLKRLGTRRVPQWAPISARARCRTAPAASPGRSTTGRGCAASCPRLRGRQLLRVEWTLTRENAQAVERCLAEDGPRAVAEIVRVSEEGRAPKNDPALFALAMAAGARRRGDAQGRARGAAAGLPHRHAPVPVRDVRRGLPRLGPLAAARGRPLVRRAAGRTRSPTRRSSTASARASRTATCCGWPTRRARVSAGNPTARGVGRARAPVRVDRPRRRDGRPAAPGRGLRPRTGGGDAGARRPRSSASTACRARRCRAEHLTSPEVWEALLEDMPMTALIRNLATMTRVGVLAAGSDGTAKVGRAARRRASASAGRGCTRSRCWRRSGRTRPVAASAAASEWSPVREIVDALDAAFYAAFGNVEPAGKRLLLALDVSGSMAAARSPACRA